MMIKRDPDYLDLPELRFLKRWGWLLAGLIWSCVIAQALAGCAVPRRPAADYAGCQERATKAEARAFRAERRLKRCVQAKRDYCDPSIFKPE